MINDSKLVTNRLSLAVVTIVCVALTICITVCKPMVAVANEATGEIASELAGAIPVIDLEILKSSLDKIESKDSGKIKTITIKDLEIVQKYLGEDIAKKIQFAINISQIDVPLSKNLDISQFPFSEETGELQFSEISWVNLGMAIARVHIEWENSDGSQGDAIASKWAFMNEDEHVKLEQFEVRGLKEGAHFRFYSELALGHDSNWSKWQSYSKNSGFGTGYYTDKSALSKNYIPVLIAYGSNSYTNELVDKVASHNARMVTSLFFTQLAIAIFGGLFTMVNMLGIKSTAMIIFSAVASPVSSLLVLASSVLLTATISSLDVEDVDLDKYSKERNWLPDSELVTEHNVPNDEESGHFEISGFQYVSRGYFWSKPMVHWRCPEEPESTDHSAYVNVSKDGQHEKGLRMGKASGEILADLSLREIVDKNNSNSVLHEGDIIWFGAEVSAGKNRVAKERFVYSKKSDYKAGYFTQGTIFSESGYGNNPKAHLVTFGSFEKVSADMDPFILVAKGAFHEMVCRVIGGLMLVSFYAVINVYQAQLKIRELNSVNSLDCKLIDRSSNLDRRHDKAQLLPVGGGDGGVSQFRMHDQANLVSQFSAATLRESDGPPNNLFVYDNGK